MLDSSKVARPGATGPRGAGVALAPIDSSLRYHCYVVLAFSPRLASACAASSLLLLQACPLEVPVTEELTFECENGSDCSTGFLCIDHVCVSEGSDAGGPRQDAMALDAVQEAGGEAGLLDSAAPDRPAADALGADSATDDSSPGDAATADAAQMDGTPGDALVVDAVSTDTAQGDGAPVDAQADDAADVDAAPADRAVDDTAAVDALAADTAPEDVTAEDVAAEDVAAEDAALPSCLDIYGSLYRYELCEETEATCTFFSDDNDYRDSCGERCARFGGTCIDGFEEEGSSGCVASHDEDCSGADDSLICVCSRQ